MDFSALTPEARLRALPSAFLLPKDSESAKSTPVEHGFSPEELEQLTVRAKQQIRKRMRSLRTAYPEAAMMKRSESIVEQLLQLPAYQEATSVALFWPMEGKREVDLRALDAHARSQNKRVAYPFLRPNGETMRTGFAEVASVSEMRDAGRGFLEPSELAPALAQGELDLIVVPALAVTGGGHRLGYGSGFYDVTLPEFCPPAKSAVVAYDFQLLMELPIIPTDVACDFVVTDKHVIVVQQG